MSVIREFFKKKKLESKFKLAGPGHSMASSTSSTPATNQTLKTAGPSQTRVAPSESSKRAGAAALARFERNQKQQEPNWSLAAIRAQARKELELELEAQKRSKDGGPKEVLQEAAPVLAVSGVYYSCPLIGPDILSKQDIEDKIKKFLYEQLSEEMGLTSCLIIHTCNQNKAQISLGVETLSKYLTNIIENPTEEKYQKIRLSNKVFQERIAGLEGAMEFLKACGFEQQKLPHGDGEEDFLVFQKDKLGDLETLRMLKDALQTCEAVSPELDRGLRVLMPSQAAAVVNLPEDFFSLSKDEIKREQELRERQVELNQQLRTRAMKERDEVKELRRYKFTLIRIRFPDGILLQGTFSVKECLRDVKCFIIENLNDPSKEFELLSPGGQKLIKDEERLLELHLVPAVILHLRFVEKLEGKQIQEDSFLKPEIMALLQSI